MADGAYEKISAGGVVCGGEYGGGVHVSAGVFVKNAL